MRLLLTRICIHIVLAIYLPCSGGSTGPGENATVGSAAFTDNGTTTGYGENALGYEIGSRSTSRSRSATGGSRSRYGRDARQGGGSTGSKSTQATDGSRNGKCARSSICTEPLLRILLVDPQLNLLKLVLAPDLQLIHSKGK